MEVRLTREQILALAPDAASAKAAAGLATDGKWGLLGADAEVLWGECQGSGAKPYQTQVDLAALVSRCSCPSRKFPCKHGLAMLLLYAAGNPRCVPGTRPAWVDEWMQGRRERAARKEESAASTPPPDPQVQAAAAAKREQARWTRMQVGAAELQRWIADQFRQGLANLGADFAQDARRMMARMVDAQTPGLGAQLERAVGEGGRDLAQLADLGERLGLLQLLAQAVPRVNAFGTARQADLRAALGWPLDRETVLREGEAVHDRWHVQGQHLIEQPGNLLERRVWLQGLDSGRPALLQDYSHGGRGWEQHWRNADVHVGRLHFHPGTVPLRAVAGEVGAGAQAVAAPPRTDTLDAAACAHALNPWLPQVPMRLQDVHIAHDGRSAWAQHAEGGLPLQVSALQGWALLAFAGGHRVCLMGEWDGHTLLPLSAWNGQGERWERSAA
ncbi:SWIM zinc finger family protein [Xanthomonas sp. LMG 8992]|nr:SWIM zinc finger family protein [Xanthomonas sp. LMG 8992]